MRILVISAILVGDYYTPVDQNRATTWKLASELPDLGLLFPPSISFERAQAKPKDASKPAAKPKNRQSAP